MNSLNSVLIEGTITRDGSDYSLADRDSRVSFGLVSTRYWKGEDSEYHKTESYFAVVVRRGTKVRVEDLVKGAHVRVVGRLDAPTGRVLINAEHIEFVSSNSLKESLTR